MDDLGTSAGSNGVLAGVGGSIGNGDIAGAAVLDAVGDGNGATVGSCGDAASASNGLDKPTNKTMRN